MMIYTTSEEISHFDLIDEQTRRKPKIVREVENLIEKYAAKLVFRGLVFNQVWEDPEVDLRAFDLNHDDVILTITSAGCNTLNYLTQTPRLIYSLDINPTQNFLLELKMAAIRNLDYETFWQFFGIAKSNNNRNCYSKYLRDEISMEARHFWDKRIKFFEKGLYRCGHLGLALRMLRTYGNIISGGKKNFEGIIYASDQKEYYRTKIRPRIFNPLSKYITGNPFNLSCMGIHKHQIDLVKKFNEVDFTSYMEHILDSVLGGDIPIDDNYFWHMAILGRYVSQDLAPLYLQKENFDILKKNIDKVIIKNSSQYKFLTSQPDNSITKFNLLDSVDWMKRNEFINLFKEIHRVGAPDGVIIFRSGLFNFIIPGEIRDMFIFDKELSQVLHELDRSGVYGSFNIYYIKK